MILLLPLYPLNIDHLGNSKLSFLNWFEDFILRGFIQSLGGSNEVIGWAATVVLAAGVAAALASDVAGAAAFWVAPPAGAVVPVCVVPLVVPVFVTLVLSVPVFPPP